MQDMSKAINFKAAEKKASPEVTYNDWQESKLMMK